MQISQESTCVRVFFNKVAGSQNCSFIKKRLQHRFFTVNFVNYPRAPILQMIYEGLVTEHQCAFLKTPCFTEHLQWLPLTISGFHPAALIKKRLGQRCFVNFVKLLRTSFVRTPPDNCLPKQVFSCGIYKIFKNT